MNAVLPRRPARGRAVALAALALALALAGGACSASDPAAKPRAQARSWAETVRAVGEGWARGDLPAPYARDALNAARDEAGKAAHEARGLHAPAPQRAALERRFTDLERLAGAADAAVARRDLGALAVALAGARRVAADSAGAR